MNERVNFQLLLFGDFLVLFHIELFFLSRSIYRLKHVG